MNRHIASVHEGKKPFKCDICDYSFSEKSSMNKHVKSVHGGNLWLQLLLKEWYEQTCCVCSWGKETIQMCHLWLQVFSKV